MKLTYFEDYRLGAVKGDAIVDITNLLTHLPHRDTQDLMSALIAQFDGLRDEIQSYVDANDGIALSDVQLRAPIPRPRQIDCMAVNYMENGLLDKPFPINAFDKSPSAVIGPDDTMILPDVPAALFEGEAELAVVIGKRAKNVSEADAMAHVFGYMNFIDGSARGLVEKNIFFQVKSRDTFAPMGPYIVTADEVPNPGNLQVRLWINGDLRQDFNTDDMAYSIARSISWLSSIHTLEPGDIVATGTNHRGLSALHDGDRVELECAGMGKLGINVSDGLKRTWTKLTRLQENDKRIAAGETVGPIGDPAVQLTGKYADGK